METTTLPFSDIVDVGRQAQERLRAVSYFSLRDVRCEYRHGRLILHGEVESFYDKKLAQDAVAGLEGVVQVENKIEVAYRYEIELAIR